MAEAAIQYDFEPQYITLETEATFISADAIPELSFVRRRAAQQADEILESNREHLRQGEYEAVPLPIDVLGTARRVLAIEKGQEQYQEAYKGLVLDCQRLFAEVFRKNSWEYFLPVVQEYDVEQQVFMSHGQSLLEIVKGGLSPLTEPDEQERRKNEYIEEQTYTAVAKLALEQTVSVVTISECTEWATEAYEHDKTAGDAKTGRYGYGGYVPEIQKLMIRNTIFPAESDNRIEEQVGLPGTYITHEVIQTALELIGLYDAATMDRTKVHGTQVLHNKGIFDFVALLDALASDASGKRIYLGEAVSDDTEIDYSHEYLHQIASNRQKQLVGHSEDLAGYLLELELNNTDRWAAEKIMENFIKERMFGEARKDSQKAAEMFDAATAQGYMQVDLLRASGQFEAATQLQQTVEAAAPAPSYCGAGSCGLESLSLLTAEAATAQKLGLKADAKNGLLIDTERKCPCGKKSIVYDSRGNKACTSCKSTQINGIVKMTNSKAEKVAEAPAKAA